MRGLGSSGWRLLTATGGQRRATNSGDGVTAAVEACVRTGQRRRQRETVCSGGGGWAAVTVVKMKGF